MILPASLFLSAVITFAANYFRNLAPAYGRLIIVAGSLLVAETDTLMLGSSFMQWSLLLFISAAAFGYYQTGGLLAAAGGALLLVLQSPFSPQNILLTAVLYAIFAVVAGVLSRRLTSSMQHTILREMKLYRHYKQLLTLRNVSSALQSTLELDKLLHIVLTAITAGYGLGFNRAVLFLVSDDGYELVGTHAVGSLTTAEGVQIWTHIVQGHLSMDDLIKSNKETKTNDKALIDLVEKLRLPVGCGSFIDQALNSKIPLHFHRVDPADEAQKHFFDTLSVKECAVVPLYTQSKAVGVIIVDNNINFEPITYDEIDSLVPIAHQAAIAISNVFLYNRTQRMALTDALTGLYNQGSFQETLREKCLHLPSFALVVFDIDYFKIYNDTNGHIAGNILLKDLAGLIRNSIREGDLAFRFGGEEFVIILQNESLKQARMNAEHLRKRIEEHKFEHEQSQPGGKLTVSMGLAFYPDHKCDPQELLHAADAAMYAAKKTGKNRLIVYGEEGR